MPARPTGMGVMFLLCALATPGLAQGGSSPLARATMRNDVGIELLGKALIYSFHYQRMVNRALGVELGVGALGGGSSTENATVVFVPLSARLYLIPKDGSLFLTGGPVLVTGTVTEGPFDESATDYYTHVGLGFEFRTGGGFLFRGTAYGLFGGGEYFIWPGLTVGYAF